MLTGYLAGDSVVLSLKGGKQVVETTPPPVPEGYVAKGRWTETSNQISLAWDVVPVEGTPQDAALALSRLQFMSLPDEAAYAFRALAPEWIPGETYYGPDDASGALQSRVLHAGQLYKCLQTHVSQETWEPGAAPSLWAVILPGQEGSGVEVGEWVRPGSTNPYRLGDKVVWNGHLWASTSDANVWEPGTVGAPWEDLGEYAAE